MAENRWLETDVGPHFLDCLFFTERQLLRVELSPREWVWSILGLTASVQAACVLFLDERDTMGVSALSEKCKKNTIEALQYESKMQTPSPFMAPPKELIRRVQQAEPRITLSEQSKKDLYTLIDFRHDFTHLTPKGWAIQISGLPRIAKEALSIIKQILENPGLYCNRISVGKRNEAIASCNTGMQFCDNLGIIS